MFSQLVRRITNSAKLGDNQRCHTAHVRASHRRALQPSVIVPHVRTQNAVGTSQRSLPAGSGNVHPFAIIGIRGFRKVRTQRTYSNYLLQRSRERQPIGVIICSRKYHNPPRHRSGLLTRKGNTCIRDKIINRIYIRIIRHIITTMPTILCNHRAIVRCINKGSRHIGTNTLRSTNALQSHNFYTRFIRRAASNAAYAQSIAVYRSNCSGNMRSMGHGRNRAYKIPRLVIPKVITINVIHIPVIIIIHSGLPIQFSFIYPHVVAQIRMVVLHALVKHCHNDAGVSGLILPSLKKVDVCAFHRN